MSTPVYDRLAALLAIEEVLGAAAIDARGRVEASINLPERDAAALYQVLSSAVGNFAHAPGPDADPAPSFATFGLREGQIAFSASRARALIVLADPDLDPALVKSLLREVLADLAQADAAQGAPAPVPAAPPIAAD